MCSCKQKLSNQYYLGANMRQRSASPILLLALILVSCTSAQTPTDTPPTPTIDASTEPSEDAPMITKSQYEELNIGMTLTQVEEVLGGPGKEIMSSDAGGIVTTVHEWGSSQAGWAVTLTFQNGALTSKAQFGLE